MASNPVLELEDREHVRVLRLNRPERKNALSSELGWAIVSAVEEAALDDLGWVGRFPSDLPRPLGRHRR
jgi:enoyl-CoA hydratase/carnithine racemase